MNFEFDVSTSRHDAVKVGVLSEVRSRVVVSSEEFPDWRVAAQVAACMAVAIHGGMPTSILARH